MSDTVVPLAELERHRSMRTMAKLSKVPAVVEHLLESAKSFEAQARLNGDTVRRQQERYESDFALLPLIYEWIFSSLEEIVVTHDGKPATIFLLHKDGEHFALGRIVHEIVLDVLAGRDLPGFVCFACSDLWCSGCVEKATDPRLTLRLRDALKNRGRISQEEKS